MVKLNRRLVLAAAGAAAASLAVPSVSTMSDAVPAADLSKAPHPKYSNSFDRSC
jgi:hypothetical protein